MPEKDLTPIVNLLFETGILNKTPRSGFHFLGSGEQSISEHICRVMYVCYVLSKMEGADTGKMLEMSLLHDLAEARTSDLNYIHQQYVEADEEKAVKDLTSTLEFGTDILDTLNEYKKRESKEALLVKDADNLEWILSLKEQVDIGNTRAASWIPSAIKRLKTDSAKQLAKKIMEIDSANWWFGKPDDEWWVSRDPEKAKKRY